MTDPNLPPNETRPAEPTHTTTVVNTGEKPSGGGGAGLAFIIGGIVVVLAIVAYFMFARGESPTVPESIDANVDINLPEAPNLPEPPANPLPDVPAPEPAPGA